MKKTTFLSISMSVLSMTFLASCSKTTEPLVKQETSTINVHENSLRSKIELLKSKGLFTTINVNDVPLNIPSSTRSVNQNISYDKSEVEEFFKSDEVINIHLQYPVDELFSHISTLDSYNNLPQIYKDNIKLLYTDPKLSEVYFESLQYLSKKLQKEKGSSLRNFSYSQLLYGHQGDPKVAVETLKLAGHMLVGGAAGGFWGAVGGAVEYFLDLI